MTDYITTDTELTSIANAIRIKGSTSASLTFPNGFVSAIQNIPGGGGGNEDINALIEGTISGAYTNSEVSTVRYYAFWGCSALTAVSFPECTYIGSYTFHNCRSLLSLYLAGHSVAQLDNASAFTGTPMSKSVSGTYGSIFVPASLYSDYIIANNWSVYSSRFVSV